MAISIPPVTASKLPSWNRVYTFAFGTSFLEFGGVSPPTIASISQLTTLNPPDPALNIVASSIGPGTGKQSAVMARISGGTSGKTYDVTCEVTLSNGVIVSIPVALSVTATATQTTLGKLTDWERFYLFPFGNLFSEFSGPSPLSIVGTPTVPAVPGLTLGTPSVSGTGPNTVVSVFVEGGTPPSSYALTCTATLSDSSTLGGPSVLTALGTLNLVNAFT